MKKQYLTAAAAVMALALAATACSSGQSSETTAAETTQEETTQEETAAEEAAAEASEEEVDEDYFYGYVQAVDADQVTLQDEDGVQAVFDVSQAEFSDDVELRPGDEIEITFLGELSEDVTPAEYVDVITSSALEEAEAAAEEIDPVVYGTIEKADDSSLTLRTEEGTYTFDATIAQKVTLGGIAAGSEAEVTYYGDLDDEEALPMATRIVTEDAMDSEDAQMYTLTGTVVEVGQDSIVLETADQDQSIFTFQGEAGMFDGYSVGDTATVIYEGTLTARVITALGVE